MQRRETTRPARPALAAWLMVTACLAATSAAGNKQSSCEELGFSSPSCGDCDRLQEGLSSGSKDAAALLTECRQCCVSDEQSKFTHAELQGDQMRLSGVPELKAFLDANKKKPKKERLTVSSVASVVPRLRLTKADGSVEHIRVDAWTKQALEDFLATRVQQPAAATAAKQ